MTYAVIMAGGIGSRFWPRSRKATPKQFLNVFGDATLIQNTIARLQGIVPPERCFIVTHERYTEQVKRQLPAVPEENILAEPVSRNTGSVYRICCCEVDVYRPRCNHDRPPGRSPY